MKTWRRSICLGSLLLVPLAAKKLLRTADRHALCFAYSKIKRYDKLMPCFDRLQQRISSGDLYTRLLEWLPEAQITTFKPFAHLKTFAHPSYSAALYLTGLGV